MILDDRNMDLWMTAFKIFELESELAGGANTDGVEIPYYLSYSAKLVDDLESLFSALFKREIKVSVVENPQQRLFEESEGSVESRLSDGHTCLFSLGLDSFSGITNAANHYNDLVGPSSPMRTNQTSLTSWGSS